MILYLFKLNYNNYSSKSKIFKIVLSYDNKTFDLYLHYTVYTITIVIYALMYNI